MIPQGCTFRSSSSLATLSCIVSTISLNGVIIGYFASSQLNLKK
jgi:hypothetical protein